MEFMIPIVMFVCIATVAIVRPITKPLGRLLDAMAQDRLASRNVRTDASADRTISLLEMMNTRLDLIDERVQFMERLSDARDRTRIGVVD
jgi:hypothetical protein